MTASRLPRLTTPADRPHRITGRRVAGGVLAGAIGAAMLGAPTAFASARPATVGAVTVRHVDAGAQRATLAHWNQSRRAAATPAGLLTAKAPAAGSDRLRAVATGPAGSVQGSGPTAAVSRPATRVTPDSYPFPYSSVNVPTADYTQWPYRLNGAIFFDNNGGSYVCSGTSVASAHGTSLENEVWTAGHCVANTNQKSPGVFDSSAEFIPAYNGNASVKDPYGVFPVTSYSVATNYLDNGDISVDEGAMQVGTNAAGRTLGQAVGWDGFQWNASSSQSFTAFGYPAASPYNGTSMIEDVASTAGSYTWPSGEGQPLIGIGNPMTGGSSGGAWDTGWSTGNAGHIDGHNDYKFYSQPNAVYSPYQDSLSNTVRCFGASSC